MMHKNTILLDERIGAHDANTRATPSGYLEFGESVEQCAIREVFEETGLKVSKITNPDFTNDIFTAQNKHYITLYVKADFESAEAELKEPNKCLKWRWCDINNLPTPLFTPLRLLIRSCVSLIGYFVGGVAGLNTSLLKLTCV